MSWEQLDGPLLPTLAELLIRWKVSQRDRARGPAGAPRGVLMGWSQHFLCHKPPIAKRNRSFEIKWKPPEVFVLEKENFSLGQEVLYCHTQRCV